jgi:hypothetical protein
MSSLPGSSPGAALQVLWEKVVRYVDDGYESLPLNGAFRKRKMKEFAELRAVPSLAKDEMHAYRNFENAELKLHEADRKPGPGSISREHRKGTAAIVLDCCPMSR